MAEPSKKRPKITALYPWLRRDYFKASVSYIVSIVVHALILLFFVATIVLDGGGGMGDSMGGKGEAFSTLVGHGMLDRQTDRTDESKALQEEIAFLKNEIYLREAEPRLQTLTAFTRFSVRT